MFRSRGKAEGRVITSILFYTSNNEEVKAILTKHGFVYSDVKHKPSNVEAGDVIAYST